MKQATVTVTLILDLDPALTEPSAPGEALGRAAVVAASQEVRKGWGSTKIRNSNFVVTVKD